MGHDPARPAHVLAISAAVLPVQQRARPRSLLLPFNPVACRRSTPAPARRRTRTRRSKHAAPAPPSKQSEARAAAAAFSSALASVPQLSCSYKIRPPPREIRLDAPWTLERSEAPPQIGTLSYRKHKLYPSWPRAPSSFSFRWVFSRHRPAEPTPREKKPPGGTRVTTGTGCRPCTYGHRIGLGRYRTAADA
jgi:hypothetical protein